MALAAFNGQALDLKGNAVNAFQVEVRRETPGAPLAVLYSDREGETPLGNPFTPNPDDNGRFRFHAAGGAYRVRVFTAGGFEAIWRYVAVGLAAESDAAPMPGYVFQFAEETADEDPGDGVLRANNADLSAATVLYVSKVNEAGSDIGSRLLALTAKDALVLQAADGRQAAYDIDGVTEGDGSPPAYVRITVSGHGGETAFTDGDRVSLVPLVAGDVVGPESSTAGQLAAFADTAGGSIVGADLGDSPPTPAVIGDVAAVRAATPGAVIHAGHLEAAAAVVILTDAATIALDWESGIYFEVTLTTNRIFGNPTNEHPGTWRYVLVKSDGGPDTLTFGNEYGGEVPTIDDVTTTKWYWLIIGCVAAGHFTVSVIDASPP